MSSVFMIVADIIRKQTLQMLFVDCDYVIEQISATALNPTFSNAILPRTLVGGLNSADLHRPDSDWNFQATLGVTVEDEPAGRRIEWESSP
jgi:hypothetical protein